MVFPWLVRCLLTEYLMFLHIDDNLIPPPSKREPHLPVLWPHRACSTQFHWPSRQRTSALFPLTPALAWLWGPWPHRHGFLASLCLRSNVDVKGASPLPMWDGSGYYSPAFVIRAAALRLTLHRSEIYLQENDIGMSETFLLKCGIHWPRVLPVLSAWVNLPFPTSCGQSHSWAIWMGL